MTAHRERYQNYIFKLLDFFRLSLIFFFFLSKFSNRPLKRQGVSGVHFLSGNTGISDGQ